MLDYLNINMPEYYAVGVKDVSVDDQNDPRKYYFDGHFKKDFIYEGMRPELVLHFLPSTKQKPDGKIKFKTDLRKYKDAIMWRATVAAIFKSLLNLYKLGIVGCNVMLCDANSAF